MESKKQSSSFSVSRFWLVVLRFWKLNQKNWLIGLLGAAGLIFSFWLLIGINLFSPAESAGPGQMVNPTAMISGPAMFFYLIGGLVLTSYIFYEIHTPVRAYQLFTLPASTLEKFMAAWFVSSVLYTIGVMVSIFLLSLMTETIAAFRFENWSLFTLFNPFQTEQMESIGNYFFYQSIFLLGAVYFRKNNFLKTVLVIITFFIGMFFIVAVLGLFLTFFVADQVSIDMDLSEMGGRIPVVIWQIGRLAFIGLMLLFGYLQLKNRQVA
jgi:hypothetical protein